IYNPNLLTYSNSSTNIGTTATTTTPTNTREILAIDSSTSPSSFAAATPNVCPLVPNAKPRAIGFVMLNSFSNLLPNAIIITAFKITASDVNSLMPEIPSDTGKAIAVVAACGNIEAIISSPNWKAFATI